MSWFYEGELIESFPVEIVGFVYCVTCIPTGRKYIGKKLVNFTKTKMVTVTLKSGVKKKKRKKETFESDWRTYYGSSVEVQHDVKTLGESAFKREMIYMCKTRGTMSYLELREQMDNRVLENPDKFYNGIVDAKIHRTHVKLD
jgi:hypothetical protein